MKKTGKILLIFGIVITASVSINFFVRENVVEIRDLETPRERPDYYYGALLLGITLIGSGGFVIWQNAEK